MGATGRDIHIDKNLSNIAMQYRPSGMIADLIAPIVSVPNQSNMFPVWSQADAFRTENDVRAPGTEAKKITRGVSSDNYFCQNYALKTALTLEDRENMDAEYIGELRGGRAQFLKSKITLNWEYRLMMQVTSGSNVGSYSTVASDWIETRTGYSKPLVDIQTAISNVQDATGYKPNRCLMGELAWRNLRKHEDFISAVWGDSGTGGSRFGTREQFKALFEFDEFLVGGAYYNSNPEGYAVAVAPLWLDNVLVYYAPPAPSLEVPSFMYSMRWRKPGIPDMTIELHPFDPKTKSEEVEIGYYQDEKITGATLGFLLTHVTSV
jgi:hypothetical protein